MRDATYFDQWYSDMTSSPARDAIVSDTLGLPPELQSTSLFTWQGIAEVTDELRMPPDGNRRRRADRRRFGPAPRRTHRLTSRGCARAA